jgi:hypothetical protein
MISKKYRKSRKSRKSRTLRQKRVIYKKKTISKRYKKRGGGIGNDIRTDLFNFCKREKWIEYENLVSSLVNDTVKREKFFTYLDAYWNTFRIETKICLYRCFALLKKNGIEGADILINKFLINELTELCKNRKREEYEAIVLGLRYPPILDVFYGYLYENWDKIDKEKQSCLYLCFHMHQEDAIRQSWDFMELYEPGKITPFNWGEPANQSATQ